MKIISVAGAALLLAGQAGAAPFVVTPSGRPDAVFHGMDASEVVNRLKNGCLDRGMRVQSSHPGRLVCAYEQARRGGGSETILIIAEITPIGQDTRVQAIVAGEGLSKESRAWATSDGTTNFLQGLLLQAGGEAPKGSTSTRPFLGVRGKNTPGARSWPVLHLDAGGPAERAGLKVGDVVTQLNGAAFRDFDDFVDQVSRLPLQEAISLTVTRAGRSTTISLMPITYLDYYRGAADPSGMADWTGQMRRAGSPR